MTAITSQTFPRNIPITLPTGFGGDRALRYALSDGSGNTGQSAAPEGLTYTAPTATTQGTITGTPSGMGTIHLTWTVSDTDSFTCAIGDCTILSFSITVDTDLVSSFGGEIFRIEPQIKSVTLRSRNRVRLEIDAYGIQDILDNDLLDGPISIAWSDGGVGGSFNKTKSGQVTYTAPNALGSHTLTATVVNGCFAEPEIGESKADAAARCSANFTIIIRRSTVSVQDDDPPLNPSGSIPSVIVDEDGTSYSVFTPVDGGGFLGEGFSITADSSAVADGEILGISMSRGDRASNTGASHQRYTLDGEEFAINVVDASGSPVSSYQLQTAAVACVPMPAAFRSNISKVSLVAMNDDDTFTVLSSKVKLTGEVIDVCGRVSTLPAKVAVGVEGAPADFPAPASEPSIGTPDTGGAAPPLNLLLLVLILNATLIVGLLMSILLGRITYKGART